MFVPIVILFVASFAIDGTLPLGIPSETYNYPAPLSKCPIKDETNVNEEYDFVIIGAGSGGSVLANRLTEIAHWNVLLIEAGKDEIFLTDIPLMAPAMQITAYNWGYKTEPSKRDKLNDGYCLAMIEGRCNWPRGKAIGGTSVINFMIHSRGSKIDYDNWSSLGNDGWSYDEVIPYFLKSENTYFNGDVRGVDRTGRYHGKHGYLDVTTSPYVSPLREPFLRAGEEMGYRVNDCNADDVVGFCVAQANLRSGKRVSASKAFLRPVVHRTNLHVTKRSRVTRIVVNGVTRRAVGVEFVKDRRRYFVKARKEVLLSAGALNSPQLLMLSGIGPRDHLEEVGIEVIEDLPVGYNLQDHTSMAALTFLVNDSVTIVESRLVSNVANTLNYFTRGTGPLTVPGGAEAIAFVDTTRIESPTKLGPSSNEKSSNRMSYSYPNTLTSSKNRKKLYDRNFTEPIDDNDYATNANNPDIELVLAVGSLTGDTSGTLKSIFGFTDEWYDELLRGYKGVDAFSIVPVLLHPKSRGRVSLRNSNPFYWPKLEANYYDDEDDLRTMIRGIRKAIEVASTRAFERFNATLLPVRIPGCGHLPFDSDDYWACAARHASTTLGHFVGTCKMGTREDLGVVDASLKVHGINGLRVVDASVMPLLISGHTNAPTYMIGEKASDMIKEEWLKLEKSPIAT